MRRWNMTDVMLAAYALFAVWYLYEIYATERMLAETPEVTLPAIVVEMDDPFPCSSNREHRIAFARQGAVCSGVQR